MVDSEADVAPAAFLGATWQVIRYFVTHQAPGSSAPVPGCSACIGDLFGVGALDAPAGRLTGFLGGSFGLSVDLVRQVIDA